MVCTFIKTLPVANTLGESVLWDEFTETIWWSDIEDKKLFSYKFKLGALDTYDLPERLGSFAMIEGSSSFLAAFETGLAIYDPKIQSVDWLETIYKKASGTRLNDGRVDRQGRFWIGAMVEAVPEVSSEKFPANLFRYTGDKTLSVQATDIQISNSLCWSPSGTVLYFADSPKNTIWAYDMSIKTGEIRNKRIFAKTEAGVHPDGSCVDAEGCIWNAQWGAGQVVRYRTNGDVDFVLDVPSLQPTCVSFGGPELDHVFITSARLDMSPADTMQYPQSGGLFIYKTPYKGLPESRFQFIT